MKPKRYRNPQTGEVWDLHPDDIPGAVAAKWEPVDSAAAPAPKAAAPAARPAAQNDPEGGLASKAYDFVMKPLVSSDKILSTMSGVDRETVGSLRDAPPTVREAIDAEDSIPVLDIGGFKIDPTMGLDTEAGRRAFISGAGMSASDTLSSFTSPASLATLGLGRLSRAAGTVGRGAKTLLTGMGLYGGAEGAGMVSDAIENEENLPVPDQIERLLTGSSAAAGGVAGGKQAVSSGLRGIKNRQIRNRPAAQRAGLQTNLSSTKASQNPEQLAKDTLGPMRAEAQRQGMTPKDFGGWGGAKNISKLASGFQKDLHSEIKGFLQQHGKTKLTTQEMDKVFQTVMDKVQKKLSMISPDDTDTLQAIEDAAAPYASRHPVTKRMQRRPSLEQIDTEITKLNAENAPFYGKTKSKQVVDLNKSPQGVAFRKALADALREVYDEKLSQLSNEDIRGKRSMQQKLIDVRDMADKTAGDMAAKHAEFITKGPWGRFREQAGWSPVSWFKGGAAAVGMKSPAVSTTMKGAKNAFAGVNEKSLLPSTDVAPPTGEQLGLSAFLQQVGLDDQTEDEMTGEGGEVEVRVIARDGTAGYVPMAQLDQAKREGYRVAAGRR